MKPQTRHQKRTATATIGGVRRNILHFIAKRASDLPNMQDRQSGKHIDHVDNLKHIYMTHGMEGVDNYVARVHAVIQRDCSPKPQVRFWGWLKIKWYKLIGVRR